MFVRCAIPFLRAPKGLSIRKGVWSDLRKSTQTSLQPLLSRPLRREVHAVAPYDFSMPLSVESLIARLEKFAARYEELTDRLSDPAVFSNPTESTPLAKERAGYEEIIKQYRTYQALQTQIHDADLLRHDETMESALRQMAEDEWQILQRQQADLESKFQRFFLPADSMSDRNLLLEIRAGTGGEEASLFSGDLFRMYMKYAEMQGWKTEILEATETSRGGFREVTVAISGKGSYQALQYESGVHRVQRVPKTEANGRIHTSTVTVAVLPEAEEIDIQIDPKDLRIDTFCATGPGGQSVNTTYSAIRITHMPTGIVVSCQDERSQLKNRNKAMRVLRTRLLQAEQERKNTETAEQRKSQIGTGDRSEKIRTYNFRDNRITDHRINLSLYQMETILAGNMVSLTSALIADAEARRLETDAQ